MSRSSPRVRRGEKVEDDGKEDHREEDEVEGKELLGVKKKKKYVEAKGKQNL